MSAARADGFHPVQSLAIFPALGDLLRFAPDDQLSLALDGPFALPCRRRQSRAPGGRALPGGNAGANHLDQKSAGGVRYRRRLRPMRRRRCAGLRRCGPARTAGCARLRPAWAPIFRYAWPRCRPSWRAGAKFCAPAVDAAACHAAGQSRCAGADPRRVCRASDPQRRGDDAAARPLPGYRRSVALSGLHPQRSGSARARAAAGDRRSAGRDRGAAGRAASRMSGSGATCFGIFADQDCCERAAQTLKAAVPGWWVAASFVPESGIVHEEVGQDIGPSDAGL